MALLTALRPTSAGVLSAPAAVSSSDTIQASDLGSTGAFLRVINGGASPDTVALVDGGSTPAGNAGVSAGGSVAAGATKYFFVDKALVNPVTGLATVTHSFTTTVTCELLPIG